MLITISHASDTLADESGYNTESSDVSDFRNAVLSGAWASAEAHLANIPLHERASIEEALFLIREQKFLEALEDRIDIEAARKSLLGRGKNVSLKKLRNELGL